MKIGYREVRGVVKVCIVVIAVGIVACTIGAVKAIKSKFRDLDAIIWCFAGSSIAVLGTLLARLL